eukprot:4322916-Amphidinium_carterae.1
MGRNASIDFPHRHCCVMLGHGQSLAYRASSKQTLAGCLMTETASMQVYSHTGQATENGLLGTVQIESFRVDV